MGKSLIKKDEASTSKDMLEKGSSLQWYAARCLTGNEYLIKKQLSLRYPDCVVYIPRLLSTDVKSDEVVQRTEKMLPGYILLGTTSRVSIGAMEESVQIIGRVSWREVQEMRGQEYSGPIVIDDGTKVIITEGPFMGCKGNVSGKTSCGKKVKVHIRFREVEFDVEINKTNISGIK